MSQRRATKRKRETEPADSHDQPQVVEKELVSKRARLDNKSSLADGRSKGKISNSEKLGDKGSAGKSAVRRSGRTPKAKARDYDDITHVSSSPDLSKDLASSSTETLSAPSLESSHGDSLTVEAYVGSTKLTPESSNPKGSSAFDVGYKRETRKSYQKYLEELGFGNDLSSGTKKRSRQSSSEREQKISNKDSNKGSAKKNDRTKSYVTTSAIQPNTKTPTQATLKTPTQSILKTPTQSNSKTPTHSNRKSTNEQRVKIMSPAVPGATSVLEQSEVTSQTEGDLGDFSPQVRTSKRTPVPKRKFSLLEDLPEDSKKAKKTEPGEDKIQSLEKQRHPEGERSLPSETQLRNDKPERRLSVEKTTKSSDSDTSTLPSVKGQTPEQRARDKRQDSTPQSKRSSGKVKNVKSSNPQVPIESQTLLVSDDASVAVTVTRTPETPKSHILESGIEQVVSQKRSDRKRRKRAPVSSVTARSVSSVAASPSVEATSHKMETTSPAHAEAVPISEIVSAVASKHKTPEKVVKSKQKPSQKSSEKKKKGKETPESLASDLSSPLGDGARVKLISPTVSVVSPGPTSSSKQEISPPGLTDVGDSDSTKKKKKIKKDHSSEKTPKSSETTSESELSPHHHHHHHHHHHKHHKHSKTKKLTETATAEVREEAGEHIILKLHLHKDESSKKFDIKKQKSKISTDSSSGESKKHAVHSKAKKGKSSESSVSKSKSKDNSSDSGVTESKKKLSIKFKGLSQNQIGLEIPTDSVRPSETETVAERTELSAVKHKQKKDEKKKKKSSDSGDKTHRAEDKDLEEKKPVKLVIKKDKTLLAGQEESLTGNKLQAQSKTKKIVKKPVGENSAVKKEGTGEQKKKGKEGTSSKTSLSPKKALSAYLLFCKKHRHKVLEEFPGIEFSQISKKVGEAWNNLPEEEKQYWKDKAAELKRQLLGSDTTTPKKPVLKQQAKSERKGKSKSSHSKGESLPTTPTAQPIDMAAHLKLLGESLMTVGLLLKQQDQLEVHGSLSVLLDSALCAISPLLFLTSQIPEIAGVSKDTQVQILDNLAYIMPGL